MQEQPNIVDNVLRPEVARALQCLLQENITGMIAHRSLPSILPWCISDFTTSLLVQKLTKLLQIQFNIVDNKWCRYDFCSAFFSIFNSLPNSLPLSTYVP
jgi:hypothetical protein